MKELRQLIALLTSNAGFDAWSQHASIIISNHSRAELSSDQPRNPRSTR
jgi:hypothetical protein